MNINARQLTLFDVTRMDVTTALGFFGQIKAQLDTNATRDHGVGSTDHFSALKIWMFEDKFLRPCGSKRQSRARIFVFAFENN